MKRITLGLWLSLAALLLALPLPPPPTLRFPIPSPTLQSANGHCIPFPAGTPRNKTVIGRDGNGPTATVRIKLDNIYNGKVVNSQELSEVAGDPMGSMPEAESGTTQRIVNENMTVKGAPVQVTTIITKDKDGSESTWSVSAAVPVYGLVRQTADGKTEIQLQDYGTK